MKKHWEMIAVIAAVILALVFLVRSCRLNDRYSGLKGEYRAYRAISIEDGKLLAERIGAKTAEIEALTRKIADIIAQAGRPSEAEIEKDKTIAVLRKQVATLESQGDLAGALTASKAECAEWSKKFTLAEERHKSEMFNLNATWQAKYDAQVGISEAWKAQCEREGQLRLLAEGMNGVLERKVKIMQFTGTVKSTIVIAAIAYLGFQAIKAK